MFGIRYLKVPPTTYVMQYRRGQVVRQGAGISFLYFAPNSVIVSVPHGSIDVPFVFNEITADFQDATLQGQLTFRVKEPARLAGLLDFSLDAFGRHRSDDPAKLNDRLIHATQILTRAFTQRNELGRVLVSSDALVQEVLAGLREAETVAMLGVEVLALSITSIRATPEMAKALQADAREKLLQKADEAIYARRNTAVELERQIKENELKTEIAVELKRREVRETKLQADIVVEQKRAELVDQRVANDRKESQAKADALRAILDPLKEADWRTLMVANRGGLDARGLVSMGFLDLAQNAEKIGNLNISPELLNSLLGAAHDGADDPSSGQAKTNKGRGR